MASVSPVAHREHTVSQVTDRSEVQEELDPTHKMESTLAHIGSKDGCTLWVTSTEVVGHTLDAWVTAMHVSLVL